MDLVRDGGSAYGLLVAGGEDAARPVHKTKPHE
jgi:hypothetical protein